MVNKTPTTGWWTRNNWSPLLLVLGIILAIAGHYTYNGVESFIAKRIEQQVPIRNGTDAFKKWQKLAVPMTIRFYLFNITNANDVIQSGAKPQVQQVGPYVFEETRFKIDVRFEHSGEHILYREAKQYWFDPIRTGKLSLDDHVIVPSIPELALISKLTQQAEKMPTLSTFLYNMLNAALDTTGAKLFSRQRVGDLLFDGYKVKTLETLLNILSNIPNNPLKIKSPLPNNKFGFFYLKNGTEDPELGLWRVHTGLNDASRFGQVLSYNDHVENDCWRKSVYCNAMIGTDGSQFPPNLDAGVDHISAHPASEFNQQLFARSINQRSNSNDLLTELADHLLRVEHSSADPSGKRRLFVYNPDVFRWVYLQFENKTQVRGIPAYRYTLPQSFYTAPSDAPENACFCTQAADSDIETANRKFLESVAAKSARSPSQLEQAYRKTFPAQCHLHGIMDISHCRKAPIVVSAPHFWSGDPLLIHSVEGLHPNDTLHKTYVDVEPRTGIVINAARRAQINVEIKVYPRVPFTSVLSKLLKHLQKERASYHRSISGSDYDGLIFPVLWLDETAQVDEKNANLLKGKLLNIIALLNGLTLGVFAIGIILCTLGVIHWFFCKYLFVRSEERKPEQVDIDMTKKKSTN